MCDSDDEDSPFYFELEVDDEISFKAKAPIKPAQKIETSRSSFAMPQFSTRNLVSSTELFKASDDSDFCDKENVRMASNIADKPNLPPSSAEKLLRYSMNSAVSFMETFTSLVPSFQTIDEEADESVDDPSAEDCDLSDAEISQYQIRSIHEILQGTAAGNGSEYASGGKTLKEDTDELALLIASATSDISIDCQSISGTADEGENKCDLSVESDSCESFNTAVGEGEEDQNPSEQFIPSEMRSVLSQSLGMDDTLDDDANNWTEVAEDTYKVSQNIAQNVLQNVLGVEESIIPMKSQDEVKEEIERENIFAVEEEDFISEDAVEEEDMCVLFSDLQVEEKECDIRTAVTVLTQNVLNSAEEEVKCFDKVPNASTREEEKNTMKNVLSECAAVSTCDLSDTPMFEEKEEDTPMLEEKEEDTPMLEEKEEDTPMLEEKEEDTPMLEEKEEDTLMLEEKEEDTPMLEEKEEDTPMLEEKEEEEEENALPTISILDNIPQLELQVKIEVEVVQAEAVTSFSAHDEVVVEVVEEVVDQVVMKSEIEIVPSPAKTVKHGKIRLNLVHVEDFVCDVVV